MLLESNCSKERSLETMRGASANNSAKSAHRITGSLTIVRQVVEPPLNTERTAELTHNASLSGCKRECRRNNSRCIGELRAHYCFLSSIVQMSLCLSPMVK